MTVQRLNQVAANIASLRRCEMHHIMPKDGKAAQQQIDLECLAQSRAFISIDSGNKETDLKGLPLDKYEKIIHGTCCLCTWFNWVTDAQV